MRWADFKPDDRARFLSIGQSRVDRYTDFANEAFIRKNKLLTAVNSGGVITLLSFIGAIPLEINKLMIAAITIFITRIVSNGVAIFLAENRFNQMKEDYIRIFNDFIANESPLTHDEYDDQVQSVYANSDASIEDALELLSGCFFSYWCFSVSS